MKITDNMTNANPADTKKATTASPTPSNNSPSPDCCATSGAKGNPAEKSFQAVERDTERTVVFTITGMSCLSCVQKIESAIRKNTGVGSVVVDLASGEAWIRFDSAKVTLDEMKESIRTAGYEVSTCRINNAGDAPDGDANVSQHGAGLYPYLIGAAAALGAIGFYLGFITLTSDWSNARMQFAEYRWWILALAAGLGVQAALFCFLRRRLQGRNMKAAKSGLAASGGISTASMAACCAHYLAAFLPALGLTFLSTAAASLVEYQTEFFLVGVLSNLFGIGVMLRLMGKNGILHIRTLMNNFNFGHSRS